MATAAGSTGCPVQELKIGLPRQKCWRCRAETRKDLGYSVNYQVADPYALPQSAIGLVGNTSNLLIETAFI